MKIFDISLDKLRYVDFFKTITRFEKQNIVFTPNPEILLQTNTDLGFKQLLQKAQYLTPDGIGLYIAFQILDTKIPIRLIKFKSLYRIALLPLYFFNLFFRKSQLYQKYWERICGSDLTKDLLYYSEAQNAPITIIDLYNPTDANKVASQAKFSEKLQAEFPELKFDYIIYNPEKKTEILEQIKTSDSKILFSTLWMKKQEQSVVDIMEYCPNIKLWLWIGSSFDYFIGFQKRAPKIFCSLGLEWFYRIFTWPQKIKRLKRIYNAIFVFLYKVITQ